VLLIIAFWRCLSVLLLLFGWLLFCCADLGFQLRGCVLLLVGIVGVGAFSVEGGWVMLFLLLPVFFTWACWMLVTIGGKASANCCLREGISILAIKLFFLGHSESSSEHLLGMETMRWIWTNTWSLWGIMTRCRTCWKMRLPRVTRF
jgi:hypothetical protein